MDTIKPIVFARARAGIITGGTAKRCRGGQQENGRGGWGAEAEGVSSYGMKVEVDQGRRLVFMKV